MIVKRRNRLIGIATYLLLHPNHFINFRTFTDIYHCSKPSLSNDIAILRKSFRFNRLGDLETDVGCEGGIVYVPLMNPDVIKDFVKRLVEDLNKTRRHLSGGYMYVSDLLDRPSILGAVGRIIATRYLKSHVDVILTMSNKNAIAPFVARFLDVPFITARRHSRISDGAVMSVNCFSSDDHLEDHLVLPKLSLRPHSRVLIVGDFLKGGSTVNGMLSLVKAFDCSLVDISIFIDESLNREKPFHHSYSSLISFVNANSRIRVQMGNMSGNWVS